MSKLINYNSFEGKILKEIFQDHQIDPYISLIVESYIYEKVEKKYNLGDVTKYMKRYEKKEGLCEEIWSTIDIYINFFYKKDKKHGVYKWWYKNKLVDESNYKEGKLDGEHKKIYLNGQISFQCNYIDDKKEGFYQTFSEEGKILECGNYTDNKKEGIIKFFYDNGNILKECNYEKGKLNGLYKEWDKNGILVYIK